MKTQPLADRMRPKSFDEVVGQKHLVGENGIGKTTFLKAIRNKAEYNGKIKWGRNIKISYFEQENKEQTSERLK